MAFDGWAARHAPPPAGCGVILAQPYDRDRVGAETQRQLMSADLPESRSATTLRIRATASANRSRGSATERSTAAGRSGLTKQRRAQAVRETMPARQTSFRPQRAATGSLTTANPEFHSASTQADVFPAFLPEQRQFVSEFVLFDRDFRFTFGRFADIEFRQRSSRQTRGQQSKTQQPQPRGKSKLSECQTSSHVEIPHERAKRFH